MIPKAFNLILFYSAYFVPIVVSPSFISYINKPKRVGSSETFII